MTKIICDFDGTAAQNDVGNLLFHTFGDDRCPAAVNLWIEGKITSRECLMRECAATRVTKPELERFVDAQKLDPHFSDLVRYTGSQKIEIEIVSDGLDFYIERILKNHHLDSPLKIHANHLIFVDQNQIRAEFPYSEFTCGHCGNCKGYHVRRAKSDGSRVIYIGDGLSDRCGAREADVVFAKRGRDLLTFCRNNHIHHYEFENFLDVMNVIRSLVNSQ
ncbi:MAG TPA: MtnX-like HAD-IB family phosphatase [bacterium]